MLSGDVHTIRGCHRPGGGATESDRSWSSGPGPAPESVDGAAAIPARLHFQYMPRYIRALTDIRVQILETENTSRPGKSGVTSLAVAPSMTDADSVHKERIDDSSSRTAEVHFIEILCLSRAGSPLLRGGDKRETCKSVAGRCCIGQVLERDQATAGSPAGRQSRGRYGAESQKTCRVTVPMLRPRSIR